MSYSSVEIKKISHAVFVDGILKKLIGKKNDDSILEIDLPPKQTSKLTITGSVLEATVADDLLLVWNTPTLLIGNDIERNPDNHEQLRVLTDGWYSWLFHMYFQSDNHTGTLRYYSPNFDFTNVGGDPFSLDELIPPTSEIGLHSVSVFLPMLAGMVVNVDMKHDADIPLTATAEVRVYKHS